MAKKKDLREGIVKMREVAELLSGWADDLERSVEKETERKPAAETAAVKEVPAPPSFEEVRGLLAAKSAAGCRTQVLALIQSYGVEKLSEVDPAHYAELLAAAALLGTEGDADAG